MVEFFPRKENYETERLEFLDRGDYFSMTSIGNDDFEIFIIVESGTTVTLTDENEIPAVSLKTGQVFFFTKDFPVYPLNLTITYSHQPQ